MKEAKAVPTYSRWLFLVIMPAMLCLIVFERSGSLAQSRKVRPTPTRPTVSPSPSPPTSVIDQKGDTYRLVFPLGPESLFCDELNKAGAQGYEVVSVAYRDLPAAMMK